jgi:hypothetical protein
MVIKYVFDVGAPSWVEHPVYEYDVPRYIVEPLLEDILKDLGYPDSKELPIEPYDDYGSEEPYSLEEYIEEFYYDLLDIDYIREAIEDLLYSDFYDIAYEEYMNNEADKHRW